MSDEVLLKNILEINKDNGKMLKSGFASLNSSLTKVIKAQNDGAQKITGMLINLLKSNRSVLTSQNTGFKKLEEASQKEIKKTEEIAKEEKQTEKAYQRQWMIGMKGHGAIMTSILKANRRHTALWKLYEDKKAARLAKKDRMAPNKLQQQGLDKAKDAWKSAKSGDILKAFTSGIQGLAASIAGGMVAAVAAGWKALSAALPTALKTGAKQAAKGALRFIPLAGAVIGIAEAIADGIAGWTNSEDWGVSKLSGFLGGFFAGDGEGGIVNAFKNAGKWAGIGATAGLVVPVVGPIVGGIIGAALGGILGWVGGKKLAEGFDSIGNWFAEKWDSLVVEPITKLYEALAPEWFKNLTFTWEDFFPPALLKLMRGDYIKLEFPEFTWTDIFPKFLVDFFSGTADAISESAKDWKWYNIFPEFLVKFFTGEYAKDEVKFSWYDLFPKFLQDIFSGVGKGFDKMVDNWEWYSIFPNFLVKLFRDTKVTVSDEAKDTFKLENLSSLEWWAKNFMPNFVWKLMYGRKEAKDKGEEVEFNWMALVPDWLKPAIASFQGLAKGFKESDEGKAIGEGIDATFDFADMVGESINAMIKKAKTWIGEFFTFDMKAISEKFSFDLPNPLTLMMDRLLQTEMLSKINVNETYYNPIKVLAREAKEIILGMKADAETEKTLTGRSGGIVPQRVTGDQVPAILHANEIILAQDSAKLFLQAAQMFARPEYANAIKDLVKTNSDIKTQTTDALMQAGAMQGSDGGASAMIGALMQQNNQISQTMAQIPDAVMAGANRGTFQGSQVKGHTAVTSNPHERRPKH